VVLLPWKLVKLLRKLNKGKIDFKVDKFGIVHTSIGKVSFDPEKIVENARNLLTQLSNLNLCS
jgi:large subunit ribosomal protein L1